RIHQSSHQLTRLTRFTWLLTSDGEAQFAYVADVAGGVGGAEGHRVVSGLGHGDLVGVRLPVAVVEDVLEELHPGPFAVVGCQYQRGRCRVPREFSAGDRQPGKFWLVDHDRQRLLPGDPVGASGSDSDTLVIGDEVTLGIRGRRGPDLVRWRMRTVRVVPVVPAVVRAGPVVQVG